MSQVPFSSINLGMDTSEEGRLVTKAFLEATYAGLGHGETPIFPISVFTIKSGVNYNPEDPNYDLFQLACKVSAKRLFPNFVSMEASFNKQYYKEGDYRTIVNSMGCRTRTVGNVNGEEISVSRGNFAFTTINLPYIALLAKEKLNKNKIDLYDICTKEQIVSTFYEIFDKYIYMCRKYLIDRYNIIAKKHVYNFPFILGQKLYYGSEKLKDNDTIEEVLKQSTLSIGFIGLAECLKALIGKHHGESEEAQKLGLEIVKHLRDKTDSFTEEDHLNWSTFASPSENYCGVSLRGIRKRFGIVKGVSDKEYLTNSSHKSLNVA